MEETQIITESEWPGEASAGVGEPIESEDGKSTSQLHVVMLVVQQRSLQILSSSPLLILRGAGV